LKDGASDVLAQVLCRKHDMGDVMLCDVKTKYINMAISEAKRVEEEKRKLKAGLDNQFPHSRNIPPSMRKQRSESAAYSSLCVTIMNDVRRSLLSVAINSYRMWLFCWSRLPLGSSARMSFGLFIKARAMATRCCSPPESSEGRWSNRSESPRLESNSAARFFAGASLPVAINSGIATFSSALKSESRWWN